MEKAAQWGHVGLSIVGARQEGMENYAWLFDYQRYPEGTLCARQ
jgi:hypothetical protein